MLVKVISIVLT